MIAFLAPVALLTSCDDDDSVDPSGPVGGEGIYEGSDLKGEIAEAISLDPSVAYKLTAPLF
ncbi:MAG TPA: hypothetical protein DEQ30_00255, partial [Porphyromonadaceae bacterium]|nr:hypothetical protein [Porphyromonadaceae bacterium]